MEGLDKQSHTARRVYHRLVDEKGFTGGKSTIRIAVKEIKGSIPKSFIPLEFDLGEAMQIDWGEATQYYALSPLTFLSNQYRLKI